MNPEDGAAKLRVFLADDHAVVREGLKSLINAQPDMEVVGEADNGEAAWRALKDCPTDVSVLDVSMPRLSGTEVTERLRRDCPDIKILALTVHEDRAFLRELLQAGASGYVLKRAVGEELIRAIRAVAGGGMYLDPRMAGKMVSSFVHKPPLRGELVGSELSERETEVLRLIAGGYTNKEIAVQIGISVKTVETYKARSMEKLGLDSRAEIVRYALEQGWLQR